MARQHRQYFTTTKQQCTSKKIYIFVKVKFNIPCYLWVLQLYLGTYTSWTLCYRNNQNKTQHRAKLRASFWGFTACARQVQHSLVLLGSLASSQKLHFLKIFVAEINQWHMAITGQFDRKILRDEVCRGMLLGKWFSPGLVNLSCCQTIHWNS